MTPFLEGAEQQLLESVFSDDPAPDIQAALVVAHSGDECIGASWLLSRLCDRVTVFRLTPSGHSATGDAITMTGLPGDRCHELGLEAGALASDLEGLTWLVAAAVQNVAPRLIITHASEGVNLDHDAVAFAAQITALLLPRFGAAPPVVLEFQCQHNGREAVDQIPTSAQWQQGVRVDFGPESRRLKEEILRSHLGPDHIINGAVLHGETYRPFRIAELAHAPADFERRYHDAPCTVGDFVVNACAVSQRFAQAGLIAAR